MGVTLPPDLAGVTVTRCLTIDAALWFIVVGTLITAQNEALDQTGALDEATAQELIRAAVDDMIEGA